MYKLIENVPKTTTEIVKNIRATQLDHGKKSWLTVHVHGDDGSSLSAKMFDTYVQRLELHDVETETNYQASSPMELNVTEFRAFLEEHVENISSPIVAIEIITY